MTGGYPITNSEGSSGSVGARLRRVGKRIGCAGIVSVAAVALGLSAHHDLQFTANFVTPRQISSHASGLRWEECIYQAIRSQVPEGAAVYPSGPTWALTLRLAELSTPWAVPQASPATAHWRLSLVPAYGQCTGLALEARRI
jgi:hypothetical protein